MGKVKTPHAQGRAAADRSLDVAIATEVAGFRWVTWNDLAIGGAPLSTPGRFLAHPGDLLAHLHLPADLSAALAEDSLDRVPRYSEDLAEAFRVANDVGLFTLAQAALERESSGLWAIRVPALDVTLRSEHLPQVVCDAALLWARRQQP